MASGKKRHSMFIWVVMGFIMLGLGGYGVTEFSSMGLSGVASVGETRISSGDYLRVLRRDVNEMSARLGRHVPLDEARQMGLVTLAQQRLFTSAALEEEARVLGVSVGDARVAQTLLTVEAFQGLDGRFDRNRYAEALRREGLTEAEFEHDLRMDEARRILLAAVAGGIDAPRPLVDRSAAWRLQSRDIAWRELTPADLPNPVTLPDEAALKAWHEANSDRFTAPEIRHFTVAWLSPDRLQDEVMIDEDALRALYDEHVDEYRQPERRLLGRLVYPSMEAAQAARDEADAGASFADLAAARGLSLADTDLGEVTEARLGSAGPEVFAAQDTGIVGPVVTDLGPALFSVNAILDPVDVPFEEAREDLRVEAADDQARRLIETRAEQIIDLVAGGAAIEDLAEAAGMAVLTLDWRAEDQPQPGTLAAYPAFREAALAAQPDDFPELHELEDGGIFALRLDAVTPPEVIPFEEARAAVEADWLAAETRRRLLALADAQREAGLIHAGDDAEADPEADPEAEAAEPAPPAPQWHAVAELMRDGYVDGAPLALVSQAFALRAEGEVEVVDAEDRVILVRLDAIHNADLADESTAPTRAAIADQLQQSLAADVADAWLNAAMQAHGVRIDASAMQRAENMVQ